MIGLRNSLPWRRISLVLSVLALWLLTPALSGAQEKARPPNILLLLSDDQRHDTIAALGNKIIRTPNLDKLVQSGTTFTHTSDTVPVCTPSRAELLSGRSPFRNGVRFFNQTLDPNLTLLPQALAKAGYVTWFTGKWHNDGTPDKRGFQITRRVFKGGMWPHEMEVMEDKKKISAFSSELFAGAAIDFLKSKPKQPWFVMVAFTAPHDPRTPPGKYKTMYDPAKMPLPPNYMPEHPFDNGEMTVRDEQLEKWPRTREAIRRHLAAYYGMISHLDEQIGRILQALADSGQLENTIIVFLGDNGLAIGSHGLMGKQSMYDHSVRIPFIISGPGVPKNQRSDALCYMHDVYPTVCELAGVDRPKSVEGLSLVPILKGKQKTVREYVCCAHRDVQRLVRTERWALIHYPEIKKTQLFDMKNDPYQLSDLLASWRLHPAKGFKPSIEPAVVRQTADALWTQLLTWQKAVGDPLKLPAKMP
jgi:arylsulfatase A-like enzyme